MRAAIVNISENYLRDLLELPDDAEIVSAQMRFDAPGVVQLMLRGAGYPVEPGMVVPHVTGTVHRHGGAQHITWPFGSRSWPFPEPNVDAFR